MTAPQFRGRAYGFDFESDFELAEAGPALGAQPEIRFRSAPVATSATPGADFRTYVASPSSDLLEYRGVGRFLVHGGNTVEIDLEPEFDARLLGLPLLGPVMSLLLHRRGLLVLHGSAVLVGGEAHVFLGDKGAGKSTTAASLVAAGSPLVSDDVVAVKRMADGRIVVLPGFPSMKLDREHLARFSPNDFDVLGPEGGAFTAGKFRVRLRQPVPDNPVLLGKVHCLQRGSETSIEALSPERRLHALIRFSHYPRLGDAASTPAEAAHLFRLAAGLAKELEVDTLVVRDSLARLGELANFLMEGQANASIPA